MKRILLGLALTAMCAGFVFGQDARRALSYKICLTTAPYEVIDDAWAGNCKDWLIENLGPNTAWLDFDSVISTIANSSAISCDKSGKQQGSNWEFKVNRRLSSKQVLADQVYMRTILSGTTIQVMRFMMSD